MLHGAPGFFSPRPFPPVSSAAEKPDLVSYYDISPLKETLARLVNFDLIDSKTMRFSVGATHIRTGASVYFDNWEQKVAAAHVIASASLPPGFPPTEIDGEYYWDAGVVSNSPMQFVVDNRRRNSALVFQVDLWDANGECRSTFHPLICGQLKSTAPAVSIFRSNSIRKCKNSGMHFASF
jgi:NTE family protein